MKKSIFSARTTYLLGAVIVVAGVSALIPLSTEVLQRALQLRATIRAHETELGRQRAQLAELSRTASFTAFALVIERRFGREPNAFKKAVAIRDEIYRNVLELPTPEKHNFEDFLNSYKASLSWPDHGHICGGKSLLYIAALEAIGIPARFVGLYSSNAAPYDSHATVEFFDDGRWYASDPTFQEMYMSDGQYLSYRELHARVRSGLPYTAVDNGRGRLEGRPYDKNYYKPLPELMKFVVIHPATTGVNKSTSSEPMTYLPAAWDGQITLQGGDTIAADADSALYQFLRGGPAR